MGYIKDATSPSIMTKPGKWITPAGQMNPYNPMKQSSEEYTSDQTIQTSPRPNNFSIDYSVFWIIGVPLLWAIVLMIKYRNMGKEGTK